MEDLCDLFVQVSVEQFDERTEQLNDNAIKATGEILKTAKRRSGNSFETPNSLLTSLGLLKVSSSQTFEVILTNLA